MFGPKIPVVAAAVGFVLSFLIGLFSGAAFPVFLFRAVIMALFFAAIAAGVHLLIQRFLPELLDSTGDITGDQGERATGSVVDLTVGDQEEDPVLPFGNNGEHDGNPGSSVSSGEQPDGEQDSTDSFFDDELEQVSDNSVPENTAAETEGSQSTEPEATESSDSDSISSASPDTPVKPKPRGAAAGLDVLPDLQDFIPEKKPDSEDDTDDDLPVEPVVHGFSVPDVSTDVVETETMAKAIRTILSKDN